MRQFHSEILPDDRAVSVYLPPQYLGQKERRFPVLYLQDGQNLFDGRTSYIAGKTWNANTTADRLTEAGEIEPLILVGIAYENLVAVLRVDRNARVIANRQVAAATYPALAAVVRHIERLLSPDVDVGGALLVLSYRTDRNDSRDVRNLPPGLSSVARNLHA